MHLILAMLFATTLGSAAEPPLHPAAQIAAAELEFARHSERAGMHSAFAAWFADDAVDFAPMPRTNAREHHVGKPEAPISLRWYPAYTLAAASGDFGLSTGPYELADRAGKQPVRHGHYVSVWRRSPDGDWRVAIDAGISHPAPAVSPEPLDPRDMEASQLTKLNARADGDALLGAEAALTSSGSEGLDAALQAWGEEELRLYRDGTLPAVGMEQVLKLARQMPGSWRWETQGSEIAASGDLGYTYGISSRTWDDQEERSAFLHVWQWGAAGWKLVLVRESALPG